MNRHQLKILAPRLVFSLLLVSGCCGLGELVYGRLLLPLYHWEIETFFPGVHVLRLDIRSTPLEWMFNLKAALSSPAYIGGAVLPAGTVLSSATLLGHAVQHVIIIFSIATAAWLTLRTGRRWLLALSLFFLVVVEMLDVPFLLVGSMKDLLVSQFAPSQASASLLIYWLDFLNGGGRLALSLASGVLAVAVSQLLASRDIRPQAAFTGEHS